MMGIINLVDMHFINIYIASFCFLRFLHEIRLVMDLMYLSAKVCVVMFVCGNDSKHP